MDVLTIATAWGDNVHSIKDAWEWYLWLTPFWKVVVGAGTLGLLTVVIYVVIALSLSDKH